MKNQSNQKLVLRCVARDVLKDLWVAVAIALSLSFAAFIWAKLTYTPSYTSGTTFVVSRKGDANLAYANVTKTQDMVDTFQTVMTSQMMYNRVEEAMGTDHVPGTIAVEAVPSTNLLTVSVTSRQPEDAFRTLKTLLQVYPEISDKVLGQVIMEVFEPPKYPACPDNPFSGTAVTQPVFFLSFLAMVLMLSFIFYSKDTVKTQYQVTEKLDTSLFSVIYHEKQYKNLSDFLIHRRKCMLLTEPSVGFLYEETLKKISTRLLYKLKAEKARILLVTSTVSGEGKTTVAMNLAQDLARRGKKVMLIDGDLKKPGLAKAMNLGKKLRADGWGSCLELGKDPAEAMLWSQQDRLVVLPGGKGNARAADLLASFPLCSWLEGWKQDRDIIIIDAPPVRRRSDTELWARCSDASLLVVRQNQAETKFINDSIDMLEGYGSGLLGCIYNDAVKGRDVVPHSAVYGYGYSRGYGSGYGEYGSYGNYADGKRKSRRPGNAQSDPGPSGSEADKGVQE